MIRFVNSNISITFGPLVILQGYGMSYPSLGIQEPNQAVCYWVHILCTLEAFFGVIYSGTCGAIIFGKIVRIRSLAPAIFSDPMTVRYGAGVMDRNDNIITPNSRIPCPVLTFRLVNLHADRPGGELVDAHINVLAISYDHDTEEHGDTYELDVKSVYNKRLSINKRSSSFFRQSGSNPSS